MSHLHILHLVDTNVVLTMATDKNRNYIDTMVSDYKGVHLQTEHFVCRNKQLQFHYVYHKYTIEHHEDDIVILVSDETVDIGFDLRQAKGMYMGRTMAQQPINPLEFHLSGLRKEGDILIGDIHRPTSLGSYMLLELSKELGMLDMKHTRSLMITQRALVMTGQYIVRVGCNNYYTLEQFDVQYVTTKPELIHE